MEIFMGTVQFSSVAQLCLTLFDPMDYTTPGLSVHHQLPELAQTHAHWVSDAILPSHPLSSPPSPAFNLSQHHVFAMSQFFASGGQSIGVSASASVQFNSVSQSCLTLCIPMNRSTARPPCPSPTPRVHPNPWPLSQWCHPTISSSAALYFFSFQSFLASGSFPRSQFFASRGQTIGASASVLPMNIQDWFPLGLTGWISLQSKGLSRVFPNTTLQKHQFFGTQLSL